MKSIKVYVSDVVEERFRKAAMQSFGYSKGALSKAAEKAFDVWSRNALSVERLLVKRKNPAEAIKGMLKHVKKSSVELQHEASKIWAEKAMEYKKN